MGKEINKAFNSFIGRKIKKERKRHPTEHLLYKENNS